MKKIIEEENYENNEADIFKDNYLEVGIRIDEAFKEAKSEKENDDCGE
jgi:hypothetical protein